MSGLRRITIGLPELHPAQREICDSPARFKVAACGRRFGKGDMGIKTLFIVAAAGLFTRFVAPSYASDSYQSAWQYAANLGGQIPGVTVHLQRRMFTFPSGGWVQFKSAEEPDSLRGMGIDFVIFDEAAHIANLQDIWEQCVRPSLMDRKGKALFISTPKGFNYFNSLFANARTEPDWASFQFPTESNPHIETKEIEALRKSLPALVARQEIDAEFVSLAGALFKRENVQVLEREPEGVQWVRSWDLAFTTKSSSDYTAGAKMALTTDGVIVIADVVQGRMEWPQAIATIGATARLDGFGVRQGVEVVGAQVGALQSLMADPSLAAYSFEPIKVLADKLTRALPLVARSEQSKFAIVRGNWNHAFLDELCAFPDGEHDDMVDACSGGMTMLAGTRAEIILV